MYLFLGTGIVVPLILKKIENVLSIVFETNESHLDALGYQIHKIPINTAACFFSGNTMSLSGESLFMNIYS